MAEKFAVKKGDNVVVLAGKDKGRTGEVLSVLRANRRVVVSGINMVKRHTKPRQGDQGGIVEKEAAIHISNVALQDPKDGKATRVGYKNLDDGRKVRFAKRSGEVIDV
ncbi:50S ribosomal protein L24 [Sneathiella litorea]|uniref:Large ribosomal subunit protein uL24 n=1 Tax=Sneathiella litorea TaxID=2606216 RepID=A0A6L8W7U7_9PROT|nr:50S ribosomal protein L24 [Sneathiella litorea]MZR31186.1 50S ribosomal protein L24 [Sneathiella litorea]